MVNVVVPAVAVELPVKVSVHRTAPEEFTVGLLQDAVKPFGNPEATLITEPVAPAASTNDPVGVAVTTAVVAESDCTEIDAGETPS